MRLRRMLTLLLIGFLIMGIILLASFIATQMQLPRVSLRQMANGTIIISIGNSTITMRANQTVPVNNTHT
jgi:hypothetical protein